jgi:hypothetical protein
MDKYIGVKLISAKEITRGAYNIYRGWTIPENENPDDEGYLVKYSDSYESWSPKEVFKEAYRKIEDGCMTFGLAIEAMKKGYKVARFGWNGKGMFVVIMPELYLPPYNTQGELRKVNDRTAKWIGEDKPLDSQAYIAMYTAQGKWQPGWLASQADMLSEDWIIL